MLEYYESFHIAGRHDVLPRFFRDDYCIRHEPGVADGLSAFMRDVEVVSHDRTIDQIKLLLEQGDFVFLAARGTHKGDPCVYIDLYRVEDARIVEHWGFFEEVPPSEKRKNSSEILLFRSHQWI